MRKKVVIVFSFLLLISLLFITTCFADYPIFYQRYTADPSGLEYNGRLYLYCSHDVFDPNHVGYIMNDFTCISTDDLKNWTDHGEVFNVTRDCSWGATLAWAPSVVYRNNKFYMYYGNGDKNIGVAVSDSPTGPFKDTRSGPLVSSSTPGVGTAAPGTYGMWIFDPCTFVDDDGQVYMYFGGGGVGNDRVIKLNSDMVSVNGSAQNLNIPGFFEASYMHKYNGKYYFTCASHYYSSPARIDYSMSSSPMSGFQITGTVLQNPPNNVSNNNHASIFTYKGNWYIAYHNREVAIQNGITDSTALIYQRSVCLDRMYYNTNGTIQQVTITKDGLTQLKYVNPNVTNEAETMAQEKGINTESCGEGGRDVSNIENGDWVRVRGVDFSNGAKTFEARVASATSGGNIEIRFDSLTGTLIGTCAVSGTGGWQTWVTKSCAVSNVTGIHDLYFKFTGSSGFLLNFNWWKFYPSGTLTPTPTGTPFPTATTPTPTMRVNTPTPTVRPVATPTPTRVASGVTFYQDYNYGGTAKTLAKGNYTMSQLTSLGIPNDWVSSVRVPNGFTVEIYQNDNFGGSKWTFTSDNPNLGNSGCNDTMSSCKIY